MHLGRPQQVSSTDIAMHMQEVVLYRGHDEDDDDNDGDNND